MLFDEHRIDYWLSRDLWSEADFTMLLAGEDERVYPEGWYDTQEGKDFLSKKNEAAKCISQAVLAKVLPCVCPTDANAADKLYGVARYFRPREAITWARSKTTFVNFPFKSLLPNEVGYTSRKVSKAPPPVRPIYSSGTSGISSSKPVSKETMPLADLDLPVEIASSKPDLNKWRQEDLWVESELMALCCGFNPESSEDFFAEESVKSKLASAKERIQRAITSKVLAYDYNHGATQLEREQNKCYLFRPSDAIAWAAPKFPDFPFSPENKSAESVNSISDNPEIDSAQDVVTLSIPVVQVTLPHMTEGLKKFFQVMRDSWSDYDPSRPPKQIHIAHEIDNALGWKSQKDGSASRNGQALASLIRPDELRELDKRVAKRGN